MDILAIVLACSLHADDRLVTTLVDVQSSGNPFFVGDLNTLKTTDDLHSAAGALRVADDLQAHGGRPAVGLLGVPMEWAARYGRNPIELFDACTNISVGTAALADYYQRCTADVAARRDSTGLLAKHQGRVVVPVAIAVAVDVKGLAVERRAVAGAPASLGVLQAASARVELRAERAAGARARTRGRCIQIIAAKLPKDVCAGEIEEYLDEKTIRRCPKHKHLMWVTSVVRRIRFHDLRHTTGSLLTMQGADLAAVQKIMRHKDPRITSETYLHLDPDYLRKEVNRLSFGAPGTGEESTKEPAAGSLVSIVCPASAKTSPGAGSGPQEVLAPELLTMERDIGFEPTTFSLGS